MKHITLTDEQAQAVLGANEQVEVRDPQGRTIAHIRRLDAFEIEVIERWKRERGKPRPPGIPSGVVMARLRRLEEIRAAEGMDEAKMLDLLRRMQAGEQV